MEEEKGSDKGERKSIRLFAFTADTQNRFVIPQLSSLHCHTHRDIFKFKLNLIHLFFLRPPRCSSQEMSPDMADRE